MSVIVEGSYLTLHYSVTVLVDGQPLTVVSSFDSRPATLTVGDGQLAPALEASLIGLSEGEEHEFTFGAGIAYGTRQAELVQTFSRKVFEVNADPAVDYAPGDVVELNYLDGRLGGVLKSRDENKVVVDFNHPLAGLPVIFRVNLIGVL